MSAQVSPLDHAPVLADVIRNDVIESVHHGSVVAIGEDAEIAVNLGSVTDPFFARSALKPVQALAMVNNGLALDGALLAIACSSHNGEAAHLALVERVLDSVGLTTTDLRNTPDLPLHPATQYAYLATGGVADSIHQNCSGKHAAMLATCVVNGWDLKSYLDVSHPLQLAIRATIEQLSGEPVGAVAVDGCGAPLFAISLLGLARCFAGIALGDQGSARARVAEAMRTHPFAIAGTDRPTTALMERVPGLIAKDGAEGVFAAATSSGAAVALKIADGNARAIGPVMVEALGAIGVTATDLVAVAHAPVFGAGVEVGGVFARPLRAVSG